MDKISVWERLRIPTYHDPQKIIPGRVSIDLTKCTLCTFCIQTCPAKAIEIKQQMVSMVESNECMFCGDCVAICKEKAIRLVSPNRLTGYFKTINTGKAVYPRL